MAPKTKDDVEGELHGEDPHAGYKDEPKHTEADPLPQVMPPITQTEE